MDYHKDTLASRVLLIVLVMVFLSLCTVGLGRILFYYQTGTEPGDALNISPKILLAHTPKVTWLEPHERMTENLEVNKFLLDEISGSYLNAWYLMNLSIKNNEAISLKDYYSAEPRQLMAGLLESTSHQIELQRCDLAHNLRMNWLAPDLQICGFEDYDVPVIKRVLDPITGEVMSEDYLTMDLEVVMTLEDGRWRIRHMVVEEITPDEDMICTATGYNSRIQDIDDIKGVNYYPRATPWHDFWSNWNDTIIRQDFRVMDSIGFNTIRIFVPYEEFGRGNVKMDKVEKLGELLDIAESNNLKVIVTLFDFLYDYELLNYSAIDRHIDLISDQIKDKPALLAWDLKNEPDLDFVHYGQDKVESWLNFVLSRIRHYDPYHHVTIGWLDPLAAPAYHDMVDFLSFHYYEAPELFTEKIDYLQDTLGVEKSILIEEFGLPTFNLLVKKQTEEDQALYYDEMLSQIDQMPEVSFMLWTLYDFIDIPNQVVGPLPWKKIPQKGFGLIKTDSISKPALKIVEKYLD